MENIDEDFFRNTESRGEFGRFLNEVSILVEFCGKEIVEKCHYLAVWTNIQ